MSCSFILTNLNPAARYNIAGSIHLNNAAYTGRITHVELQSADTCVPAHTPGVITNGLPISQAALVCYNPTGEYVAWSNIDPGPDGAIVLTCSRFTNQEAYALGALKIEELPIPVAVNSQPQDATICPGDSLALALDVSGSPPITFNWYVIANNTTNLVGTGTNSTLTLTNLQQSFSWFATASNVVNQATTRLAQVTVTTDIVITTQPAPNTSPLANRFRSPSES